jgi:hypothetical protein
VQSKPYFVLLAREKHGITDELPPFSLLDWLSGCIYLSFLRLNPLLIEEKGCANFDNKSDLSYICGVGIPPFGCVVTLNLCEVVAAQSLKKQKAPTLIRALRVTNRGEPAVKCRIVIG